MVGSEEPRNPQWEEEEEAGAALVVLGGAGAVRRASGHGMGELEKSTVKSVKARQEGRRCWKGTGRAWQSQEKKKRVGRAASESSLVQE